jgi:hypothetical protein
METAAGNRPTISVIKMFSRIKGVSMMMRKMKSIMRRLGETDCDTPDAYHDPLSHPALRAMSSRELADLPFSIRRQK